MSTSLRWTALDSPRSRPRSTGGTRVRANWTISPTHPRRTTTFTVAAGSALRGTGSPLRQAVPTRSGLRRLGRSSHRQGGQSRWLPCCCAFTRSCAASAIRDAGGDRHAPVGDRTAAPSVTAAAHAVHRRHDHGLPRSAQRGTAQKRVRRARGHRLPCRSHHGGSHAGARGGLPQGSLHTDERRCRSTRTREDHPGGGDGRPSGLLGRFTRTPETLTTAVAISRGCGSGTPATFRLWFPSTAPGSRRLREATP